MLKRKLMPEPETEAELKRECTKILKQVGYMVHSTSDGRMSHNSRGTADSYVGDMIKRVWRAIDYKTKTGKLSPEQSLLVEFGLLNIVRSTDDLYELIYEWNGK